VELPTYSLLAAIVLASVYGSRIGAREGEAAERFWSRRRWVSAAAGVSVAYVFVDVLPELAAQNRAVIEAAGEAGLLFAEQRVYVLALASFVVMYGLEYMVLAARGQRSSVVEEGVRDRIYRLHLAGFAVYSALIGYLLVERADRDIGALVIYTLAMALHFVIVNHSLNEEHGRAYRRGGHWWLAASVLVGWAAGAVSPLSEAAFARLFALLAGGVVITSLKAELPDDRKGRFWPFCLAALVFAFLLILA